MTQSRGAFFAGVESLAIRGFDLADPGPEDVVLQVSACGVCGSDLHQFYGRWPRPEVVPGHEVGGIVVEVGAAVTHVTRGDRVALEPIVRCGQCRYCLTGRYLLCESGGFISVDAHGGFADQMVVPGYCCLRLEGEVDVALGAFAEPLSVGLHAVRLARPSGEDTVLVLGAGTIGLMTVAAAKAMGAGRVVVTAKYEHQAEAARKLGADAILSPDDPLEDELRAVCAEGADMVIETVGSAADTFEAALGLVRKLGTVVLVGGWTGEANVDLKPVIFKELTVLGSPCYGQIGLRRDFEIAVELIATGAVEVGQLVSARFPLDEIQQAFLTAADKKKGAIKVFVEP